MYYDDCSDFNFPESVWKAIYDGASVAGGEGAIKVAKTDGQKARLLKNSEVVPLQYIRYSNMSKTTTAQTKNMFEKSDSCTDYLISNFDATKAKWNRWIVVVNKRTVKQEIPFETITRTNDQMKKDEQKVIENGVNGTKTVTEIHDVDKTTLKVTDTILKTLDTPDPSDKKPTPKIIEVGTKETTPKRLAPTPAPPTPEPSAPPTPFVPVPNNDNTSQNYPQQPSVPNDTASPIRAIS